ncbi:MAG: pentapeptide repeat-containing protein [Deltaproteobacteria bacterium]|nr:pentapeptide repeat-containing protein [Deltaproteobacteria bacterium]
MAVCKDCKALERTDLLRELSEAHFDDVQNELCIFHCSKDGWFDSEKDKDGKETKNWLKSEQKITRFWQELREKIMANEESDEYDFSYFVFPPIKNAKDDFGLTDGTFSKTISFYGAKFDGVANFIDAKFAGETDFTGAQFDGVGKFASEASFQYAKKLAIKARFKYAKFAGETDFTGAQFDGVEKFDSETNFQHAKFDSKASFQHAQFAGEANFSDAQFAGEANFLDAKFYGEANFRDAKFYIEASFLKAEFYREADFWNAKFDGEECFWSAKFYGEADFSYAKFYGEADFWNAKFYGEASFYGSTLEKESHVTLGGIAKHLDLSPTVNKSSAFKLTDLEVTDTLIIKDTNLNKAEFNNVNFSKCKKIGIQNSTLSACIFNNIRWGDLSVGGYEQRFQASRDIFRQLKWANEQQGNIIEANRFYALEMAEYQKELRQGIRENFNLLITEFQKKLSQCSYKCWKSPIAKAKHRLLGSKAPQPPQAPTSKAAENNRNTSHGFGKNLGEFLVFYLNKASSNFSQSWLRPIIGYFVIGFICYCLDYRETIQWFSWEPYNAEFWRFLNPFGFSLKMEGDNRLISDFTAGKVFFKIISAFLIYQFIMALRNQTRRR